jgi:HSP20 family protein
VDARLGAPGDLAREKEEHMLRQLGDMDRAVAALDELRRRMDRVWEDIGEGHTPWAPRVAPPETLFNVFDVGDSLVLKADVPSIDEKDLQISINEGVLSIAGRRRPDAPEGYSVHRQERVPIHFARSFSLPYPVDADKASATVKDGVLTITLAKAPEAQPRKISVRAHS